MNNGISWLVSWSIDVYHLERPGSAADENDAYDGGRRRGGSSRKKCTIL